MQQRLLCFALLLAACSNGDHSDSTLEAQKFDSHASLSVTGPLLGAKLEIYSVNDLENALYSNFTPQLQGVEAIDGEAYIPGLYLQQLDVDAAGWYLLVATGGEDIDVDLNGLVDTQPRKLQTSMHGLYIGQALLDNKWHLSPLSELAYQFALKMGGLSSEGITSLDLILTQASQLLLEPNEGAPLASFLDLLLSWDGSQSASRFRRNKSLLEAVRTELYQGDNVSQTFMALLHSPQGYQENSLCLSQDSSNNTNDYFIATGHLNDSLQLNGTALEKMAAQINTHHADHVFILGDLTRFGTENEWQHISSHFLNLLESDYIVLPGNHEILSNSTGDDSAYRQWIPPFPDYLEYENAGIFMFNSSAPYQDTIRRLSTVFDEAPDKPHSILLSHHNLWKTPLLFTRHSINFFPEKIMPLLHAKIDSILIGDVSPYLYRGAVGKIKTFSVGNGNIGLYNNLYYVIGVIDDQGDLQLEACDILLDYDDPWYTEPRIPTDPALYPYAWAFAPLPTWSQLLNE